MKLILHAVLEADDGPELDINTGGVLDTRLVVNPIKDAFGIPVILHNVHVYTCIYRMFYMKILILTLIIATSVLE